MANLSKAMEEMLATMKDAAAREVFRKQLEEDPAVREHFEGNLRQSDYDRQMNANKAEVERLKALEADSKKWQDWAKSNVPIHEKLLADHKKLEEEAAELRAKAAKGGEGGGDGGGHIDTEGLTSAQIIEKVNQEIAKRGFLSKADLDAALGAAVKAEAETQKKDFLEKTFPSTAAWMTTMNDLQWQHRDEFKSPLDTAAFSKFMVDKGIADPKRAYVEYTSEARDKVKEAKMREEIEKDIRSKFNLPGSGAPPAPEVGPLEARLRGAKPPVEIPEGINPGDGHLASMAAQELRAEGKS